MGIFEDMFDPEFMFDSEHKQRRDIQGLREAVLSSPDHTLEIQALHQRVDQLQLLCNALVALIEHKKLATREELEVMVQQIDLLDGIEDGKQREQVWKNAPRCEGCNYHINPDRDACVYCGRAIPKGTAGGGPYRGGPPGPDEPAPRLATCASCQKHVPQSETYFTGDGELHCSSCFSPSA